MAKIRRKLTHLNADGSCRMVDVSAKAVTRREAVASARVQIGAQALSAILSGTMPKGDVLAVARVAGIAAAKRTSELIPLCHALPLDAVEIEIAVKRPDAILITATARTVARTGVEMEALTAAGVAALAVYDMCKAITKDIQIGPIQLESKTGGKSGVYRRKTRKRDGEMER